MLKIDFDFKKMSDVLTTVNTVSHTLTSDVHVNELMKVANTLITSEFVMHMTRQAVVNPKRFAHMYDWGGVGDPNSRLWRHRMRGAGSNRQLTFEFKASNRSVPVSPALRAVGVKRGHVFVWKAPVMELGLPVRISPRLAKVLVFEEKQVKNPASSTGRAYARSGIVYYKGMINIDRQGNRLTWNSFTDEFQTWFSSPEPSQIIRESLEKRVEQVVKTQLNRKLASLSSKQKTLTFEPVGIDPGFQKTLERSLTMDYIAMAKNRRAIADE